jgi:hypothetical protein
LVHEQKVTEVARAKLPLESVGSFAEGNGHDPAVGDDEIERPAVGDERLGAATHAREVGEIELDEIKPPPDAASARTRSVAALALSRSRAAPTTRAPLCAAKAVSTRRPAETPVTRTRFFRSGSPLKHLVRGGGRSNEVAILVFTSQRNHRGY